MSKDSSSTRRSFLKGAAIAGGAATLGGCVASQQPDRVAARTYADTPSYFPRHNERTRGWLQFLWQKATTPDDWSYHGDEELPWGIKLDRGPIDFSYSGKGPHPWWDQYSAAPYLSYPRFDLSDSSYALLLMADQTPAWREVYTRILDELATRHTAYWAAIDWNTFIGPSPDRGNYPPQMMAMLPEPLRGNYDFPGWTANGVQPWGLQKDPIGADGFLFFRGWLNLLLSIYKYVSGDDKWEQPWEIAGYENEHFEWTQPRIVEHLRQQYIEHPEGPHCENTKIWPLCNSAAGLGIYLSDQLGVTNAHGVFENWIEFARDNYMGVNAQNQLEWMTQFYDPLVNYKFNIPGSGSGVLTAFYLFPQSPEIATFIYDAAANALGWRDPRREIRPSAQGLALARALGDHTVAARLSAAAERYNEPKWFGEQDEKFGWWFNLGEPWPRGQGSAQMMISEIGEGSWADAFQVKHLDKYTAPTVEGVDFPNLGINTAWNDRESGVLHIETYAGDRSRNGQATSWTITNLPAAGEVVVICDGTAMSNIEVVNDHTIRVPTTIGQHQFQVYTGYFGQPVAAVKPESGQLASASTVATTRRTAEQNVRAAESVMVSGSANCPCCKGIA
ncbi:MAG: twin-arginine translocation signal domain-containing protein [Gammaproteobacteria bacterium]|nr:twin-arginine translocation signal domain-containing protein [Pseudomonadales bacterium]